jgi:hypothetical protein
MGRGHHLDSVGSQCWDWDWDWDWDWEVDRPRGKVFPLAVAPELKAQAPVADSHVGKT